MITIRIRRFSPHQNAKVFAVLSTVGVAIFVWPFWLFLGSSAPWEAQHLHWFVWLAPLFYFVMTYLTVFIGCLVFNLFSSFTGGIEVGVTELPSS
ncbi:hypothetical protein [Hydrogenophaga sp. NFH-34]|uniref:hypothetical protein n=1 Tax=Hydrogenophaga sp. NFH-34 TaxID=2744446 RepID=UPI001F45B894|nr:hypothetical protein [Hydrogenophaga sp. NFH-34]